MSKNKKLLSTRTVSCQPRSGQGRAKPSKAVVSIGTDKKKTPPIVQMIVSHLKNKSHTDYMLTGNVQKLFHRFVDEGKMTIQIKQPQVDLMISNACPQQLKLFHKLVQAAIEGKTEVTDKMTSSKPVTSSELKKKLAPQKMNIAKRQDYPFSTSFPHRLTHLKACSIKLRLFDARIRQLQNLVVLDLQGNCIKADSLTTAALNKLTSLASLNLSDNKLGVIPSTFWCNLPSSLAHLFLSKNELKALPYPMSSMFPNLFELDVSHNCLMRLPPSLGYCSRLKRLNASHNQLLSAPYSLQKLRNMEHLDLSGNSVLCSREYRAHGDLVHESCVDAVIPLVEMTALVCVKHGLPLCVLPRHLKEWIERYFIACVKCGQLIAPSGTKFKHFKTVDIRSMSSTAVSLDNGVRPTYLVCLGPGDCCSWDCVGQQRIIREDNL